MESAISKKRLAFSEKPEHGPASKVKGTEFFTKNIKVRSTKNKLPIKKKRIFFCETCKL